MIVLVPDLRSENIRIEDYVVRREAEPRSSRVARLHISGSCAQVSAWPFSSNAMTTTAAARAPRDGVLVD